MICPECKRREVLSGRGICDVCIEREDDERAYEMERFEREDEQAMEEAAEGLSFGGSE